MKALEELERLDKISHNKNPTMWEKEQNGAIKVSSLNCRSLNKHFEDIIADGHLLKSDIIALQETWLEGDTTIAELNIPGYDLHLNSAGRGKGIATYFRNNIFKHKKDKQYEHLQMSQFTSNDVDIISLYRSRQCDLTTMNQMIEDMIQNGKPQLLVGDFNYCYLDSSSNSSRNYLFQKQFKQVIQEPTHIEGNLLDQAHLRDTGGELEYTVALHSKYYTDHKAVTLILKKTKKRKGRKGSYFNSEEATSSKRTRKR